jgi:hypothetical protein
MASVQRGLMYWLGSSQEINLGRLDENNYEISPPEISGIPIIAPLTFP